MTIHCPTCGHEMVAAHAPLESLSSAPMGVTGRAIVNALTRAYPGPLTRPQLVAAVYRDSGQGSENQITNSVRTLRAALERHGWTITRPKPGYATDGYRLKPMGAS